MMAMPEAPDSEPERRSAERYRRVFDTSQDGIFLVDGDGRFVDVNPAMARLFGYGRDEFLELDLDALFADGKRLNWLRKTLGTRASVRDAEVRLLGKDGREFTCLLTLTRERLQKGGDGETYHGILRDITARRHAEERVRHAALHDSLTELPNRTFFMARLRRVFRRAQHESEYRFAVLFLDLDRFKLVNDSLGHRAGDELLIMVAELLPTLVRPGDIVARFGGDEFTILLLGLSGTEEAEIVAERVQRGLGNEVFEVLGQDLYVTASIGVALSTSNHASPEAMIRDADTAMYAAKDDGCEKWAVFSDTMRERTVSRFATQTALQRALDRDEFVLHYQPLVAIETNRILGFEALLRWDDPERGLLPPAEFLQVAEETGLIVPIGRWVLAEACRVAAKWREQSVGEAVEGELTMAVKLSGRQLLVPGFGDDVSTILERTGLPGSALQLEITENVMLESSSIVRETLSKLADLGIKLCLDDFGTGYSSLGYLEDLPVGILKIDRTFVSRIAGPDVGSGVGMVQTILSLAREMGIGAIAEGVETEDQRTCLLGLGCGHAQGFLFSRPLGEDEARSLLDREDDVG